MDPKLYEKAIAEAKIKVLEEELIKLIKENADLKNQLTPPEPVVVSREEKAKNALSDHMMELVKAATEENISALMAAKTDFHIFADEITNRLNLLEKRVLAESLWDKYSEGKSYREWFVNNKDFIIDLIMKDEFKQGLYFTILIYDEDTTIKFTLCCNNLSTSMNILRYSVDDKLIWINKLSGDIYTCDAFSKYTKFKQVCIDWARHLKQYPNTTESFEDELKKQGII
jgi:hypothetical protein